MIKFFLIVLAIVNAIAFFCESGYYLLSILPIFTICVLLAISFKESKEPFVFKSFVKNNLKFFVFVLIFGIFLYPKILNWPLWSEEVGWINIAVDILQGERQDILSAKSDYPSSFQSWPIAFIMYFFNNPIWASRVTGMLYLILALYFICKLGALFLDTPKTPIVPALLFVLSTSPLAYVLSGWHEITYIPFLIFGMYYFLFCFLKYNDKSSLTLFAVFSGVSLWSLYMPCLVAFIISILFIFSSRKKINFREKLYYILCVFSLTSPFISIILKRKMLLRHKFLLVDVTEHVPMPNGRLAGWIDSFKDFFFNMVKVDSINNFDNSIYYAARISLGPICTLLLIIFLFKCIVNFKDKGFYWLLLPFLTCVFILFFTAPNVWREHFLYDLFIVMSVYMYAIIYKFLEKHKICQKVFLFSVILIQLSYFAYRYNLMKTAIPRITNIDVNDNIEIEPARNARLLNSTLREYIVNKDCNVFFPDILDSIYEKAFLGNIPKGKFNVFYNELNKDSIKVVCGDKEEILSIKELLENKL